MEKFDTKLLDTFQELADHFALETVQKWASNIRRRKIINSKQLLQSLNAETEKDLGRLVVAMHFAFEDHGRFLDMKNKRWKHQPPIDEILAWVKKKGLGAFGTDPKPNKTKPKTDEQRMNQIAWGIGMQYTKRDRKDKARPWFQSTFYRSLNALYEELAFGAMDQSIEALRQSLTNRLKRGATGKYF